MLVIRKISVSAAHDQIFGASDGATVADRIGRGASRRGFQYLNAEVSNRIIEVFCEITVTIVKYVFVPPLRTIL